MQSLNSIDVAKVRAACPDVQVVYFDELSSTNDWAKANASGLGLDGLGAVLAAHQTAGRGRDSNSWLSPGGSVSCSFLFLPDLEYFKRFHSEWSWQVAVSFASALAIREVVTRFDPTGQVSIKWPNDILLDNGKVSGVLIETTWGNDPRGPIETSGGSSIPIFEQRKPICIVGIGLNVNVDLERLAAVSSSSMSIASMSSRAGKAFDLSQVTIALIREFARQLTRTAILRRDCSEDSTVEASDVIVQDYNRSLAWKGARICCEGANGPRVGILSGVNASGLLELEHGGSIERLASGSVRFVRPVQ